MIIFTEKLDHNVCFIKNISILIIRICTSFIEYGEKYICILYFATVHNKTHAIYTKTVNFAENLKRLSIFCNNLILQRWQARPGKNIYESKKEI